MENFHYVTNCGDLIINNDSNTHSLIICDDIEIIDEYDNIINNLVAFDDDGVETIVIDPWIELHLKEPGASNNLNLQIQTYNEKKYIVDWGDGSYDTINSDSSKLHSYTDNSSRDVKIRVKNGFISDIKKIRLYNGIWNFDIDALPKNLEEFRTEINISELHELDGDIANLPPTIKIFRIRGNSTITGNINNLPLTIEHFSILDNKSTQYGNTITGDIEDLSVYNNLHTFELYGNNTITGDIVHTQYINQLSSFKLRGNNTIFGDIADLSHDITSLELYDNNEVTGNIDYINDDMVEFIMRGNNSISGDLAKFDGKNKLERLTIVGSGCIYGNISNLSSSELTQILIDTEIEHETLGTNYISGDIADFENHVNLKRLNIQQECKVYGDLSKLPQSVGYVYFITTDTTQDFTYTESKTWSSPMSVVSIYSNGGGLTTPEVDAILTDLSHVSWSSDETQTPSRRLHLKGSEMQPYSSDVDSIVTTLKASPPTGVGSGYFDVPEPAD